MKATVSASIVLRTKQYGKFCKLKGWATIHKQATEIGVDPATVSRVVAGNAAPGERFIAGCLTAFPELEFGDLFEVTTDSEAVAS